MLHSPCRLISDGVNYFQKFSDSFTDRDGNFPSDLEEEQLRPVLCCRLYMARLVSKLIAPNPTSQVSVVGVLAQVTPPPPPPPTHTHAAVTPPQSTAALRVDTGLPPAAAPSSGEGLWTRAASVQRNGRFTATQDGSNILHKLNDYRD